MNKPLYTRRTMLGRGAALAGGLTAVGSLSGLLAACGGDDDGDDAAGGATEGTAAAAATTAAAAELFALPYQLSWLPNVEHSGTYVSIEEGTFAGLGLDVQVVDGGPTASTITSVVGGGSLVGADGSDNIGRGRSEGAKIKIFGARLQKNPLCIMSLADNPIMTPDDLHGKNIGVAQGNLTPWDVFLKSAGVDDSDISIVPVQYDPAPTANGEVDGQVVFAINEPAQLKAKGIDTNTMLFADYGFAIFAGCYFATEETIKNHKEHLVSFLKGERDGYTKVLADPALGVKYTLEKYGKDLDLDPNQQQFQAELLETVMVTPNTDKNGLLSMDPSDIAANIDTLKLAGIDISSADLFTDEILSEL